jgi:branched-chain amino acid transport system substrate-binding protein
VLSAGAKVLVVSCDYDVSSPAALAAQAKNVVTISPCANSPLFGPSGGLKLGFSLGTATPTEGSIMAEFAHSKGWKNVVLLTDTTLKYTQDLSRTFVKRFGELGGKIRSSYNYTQGSSIKEIVSKITAGRAPDAVINCGYSPGGATAAKELRDGGVSAPILSGFGMDGDFWTGGVPGLKDYYVVTFAAKNGDDPDPAVNEAAAAYLKAYGQRPAMGAFLTGGSTLQTIKAAYDSAHSWDGDKLAAAMESFHNEDFLVGPTSFTKSLHITVDRPMRVLEVKNGKLVFVEKRTAEKVDFPS